MTSTKRVISKTLILLLLILTAGIPVSASETPEKPVILVRADNNYPPYEFLDQEGNPVGFNIDLFRAVAETMGINATIQPGPWNEVRSDLENGTIDMLTGMYYSPERAREALFSTPHIIVSHALFIRKDSDVKTLDEIWNRTVIVQSGDIMHDYARAHLDRGYIIPVENQADAIILLSSGQYDGALLARLQAQYHANRLGIENIQVIGPSLEPRNYCFAVSIYNEELLNSLNEGLAIVKQAGTYDKLYRQWFGVYEERQVFEVVSPILLWIIIPLGAFIMLIIIWSWSLKRQVARKTLDLQDELAYRSVVEESLRESEEMHRTILDNTGSATIIIEADTLISYANPGFVTISGYSRSEIEGEKSWTEFVYQEDLDSMLAQHAIRREKGEEALRNYEFRFVGKTGEVRTMYLTIDLIPKTERSVASLTDITEQKRVEEALKESEARLNSIVYGSPMLQFVIDRDHRVFSWNKAIEEYSGIPAEEMVGTRDQWKAFYESERPVLADLLIDEQVGLLFTYYQGKFSKSRFVEGAYEATDFFPKMGVSGKWLYFTAAPVRDANGEIIGAVETLEDITERKHAEEALQLANNKLSILNSITRHDILNQIMIIQGYLAIIEDEEDDPVLRSYTENAKQALEVIQWQIEFTRSYQNIGGQEPAWQSLSEIISSVAGQIPSLKVETDDAVMGVEVYADPLIEKVFYNLMENSLRHGEHVSHVRFSIYEAESGLIICYSDDGVGIPIEDKEMLFEKGFGKHTGLGLFLSREILSITGIDIGEDGEPGKGARFKILVPKGKYKLQR